ncbi:GNAT family N-acetyltransferase [Deinococcus sp. Arct2-2]|uniref:GNAT family N-acetyltransferase n=1 Tax=Deinococcus sp. Arct2-2 TaxID=2568653 RepID=UPI001454D67F|nr:GNAT family N-acetyltransferase [Deinococcus sp. Arct2-2]
MHPLDNPIWFALTGLHAPFAEVQGPLRSYPEAVAPFSAFQDSEALEDALASRSRPVVFFRPSIVPAPPGWTLRQQGEVVQMTLQSAEHLTPPSPNVTPLVAADAAEVQDLVALTRPGPFGARTMELGAYFGVREEGRLVALVGERLRLDGYVEVSAVCTHPEARGRGLAGGLVSHLSRRALGEGVIPFLHVMASNGPARRVYERVGFAERARLGLSVWVRET